MELKFAVFTEAFVELFSYVRELIITRTSLKLAELNAVSFDLIVRTSLVRNISGVRTELKTKYQYSKNRVQYEITAQ